MGPEGRTLEDIKSYCNLLFEIDNIPLEDQLALVKRTGLHFTAATYSGGKSYHFIMSLATPLELIFSGNKTNLMYKQLWKAVADKLDAEAGKPVVDQTCKNPNRLSRTPGVLRQDSGKVQQLMWLKSLTSQEEVLELLASLDQEVQPDEQSVADLQPFDLKTFERTYSHLAPVRYLKNIKYIAAPTGMYKTLFDNFIWIIDATGVMPETMRQFNDKYVLPPLAAVGYDLRKVSVALKGAYDVRKRKG